MKLANNEKEIHSKRIQAWDIQNNQPLLIDCPIHVLKLNSNQKKFPMYHVTFLVYVHKGKIIRS